MKNANVLDKLIKNAKKQQVILTKLAQRLDPNVKQYLENAFQIAAVNSGIKKVNTPAVDKALASTEGIVSLEGNYKVVSSDIPRNLQNKVRTVFERQIKLQRPELEGKVNIIYV